jgi:hypothetical protein
LQAILCFGAKASNGSAGELSIPFSSGPTPLAQGHPIEEATPGSRVPSSNESRFAVVLQALAQQGTGAGESFSTEAQKEMRKYLHSLAIIVALGGTIALAQNMPQQRDPAGAPQTDQGKMPTASTADVQKDIQSALQKDPSLAGANINAQVSDQGVELTGTAPSQDAKDAAEQLAKAHSGGLPVKNHIKVSGAPK